MSKRRIENSEINPYKVDKLTKIPSWLIILILKYWAAAAAIFFMAIGGIGIGFDFFQGNLEDPYAAMADSIVLIIMIGLGLALVNNYIIRPFVRMMYNRRNNTYVYNMINCKGLKSFFISLAYYFTLSGIMFFVINFLSAKGWILDLFGTTGGIGLEPFSYALYFIIVDYICLLIKYLILYMNKRIRYKRQMEVDLA